MDVILCETCGNAFPEVAALPRVCPLCADERQFVPPGGQSWVRSAELVGKHAATVTEAEPGLYRMDIEPAFGIGHRPALVRTEVGNLLWEPAGYLDDRLIDAVTRLGGIAAVTASHPHLVGQAVAWANHFDVPFYFNVDDERWITHHHARLTLWRDSQEILPGITLIQAGGHFPGSAVAHWSAGAEGRGVLLTGDTIGVTPRRTVSFMRSFPNMIPLPERLVRQIVAVLEPWDYDRIYSGFGTLCIESDAKQVVAESAERYIGWSTDRIRDPDDRKLT